jgi:hypothetical protein
MEVKLIVVGGDAKATEIDLKLPTVIGRGRGATLTLPHPLVSRQHCEIYEADGQLWVRDLGSLNGTFIGNEPISEAILPAGELLTVGAVTFRAIYGELLNDHRRERHAPPAARKPTSPSTRTVRNEAVETVSPPQARTLKDPRPPAKRIPEEAPAPDEMEEALAVEDQPQASELHGRFDVEIEIEAIEIEEEVVDSSSSSASLFTGAEEESADVIDDVLPEGSTFDSVKPDGDTTDSLRSAESSIEMDEVEPLDDDSSASHSELLPLAAPPPAQAAPPRNSRSSDGGARTPEPPGSKGARDPRAGDDDELQSFLRNRK